MTSLRTAAGPRATDTETQPGRAGGAAWRALAQIARRPVASFLVLSLVFGMAMAALDPPLRGHDEPAHVLRAYGIARGEILTVSDAEGRRGLHLPAAFTRDFTLFFKEVEKGTRAFDFRRTFAEHARRPPEAVHAPDVFVLYSGSEAYTPAAYLPHVAAVWVARLLGLDFLPMLYLMRIAGVVFTTLLIALAVRVTPRLKWAFVLIGLLPAALYGRAIVSADGAALAYVLLTAGLALRALTRAPGWRLHTRAAVLFLCILTKPSQVAFALVILLKPWQRLRRGVAAAALLALPGIVATLVWVTVAGTDVGTWRIIGGTGVPAEQFSLGWKIAFMLENPWHFPAAMAATLTAEAAGLWRQLIGVLGWLDVKLATWVYVFVSGCLALVACEKLDRDAVTRWRLALVSLFLIGVYTTLVFLILFITWTPPTIDVVWGVQGRYFVVVLPFAALAVAAIVNRGLDARMRAGAAIAGGLVSGTASLVALWQVNWG